jgi:hypothetical protein
MAQRLGWSCWWRERLWWSGGREGVVRWMAEGWAEPEMARTRVRSCVELRRSRRRSVG